MENIFETLAQITKPTNNEEKAQLIEKIKNLMDFELKNNFPNGDLWNDLSDKLYELEGRTPTTFEILSAILNSPKDFEK